MNFEQRCVVALPREALWAFILNVPKVAACIPGMSDVEATGQDAYKGRLGVQMGPIRLSLEGNIVIEQEDRENWQASIRTEAAERKVGGGLRAETLLTLVERGPAETELVIHTNASLLGKLGEFGQPLIRKKVDTLLQDFAKNLQKQANGGG